MTKEHFAIEKAQSEIRTRVLEISALSGDEFTPELEAERDALRKRFAEGEIKFRASLDGLQIEQAKGITTTTLDPEARELQELTTRASVGGLGAIAAGVLSGHAAEGEARELQQHYHLKGNQVPLALMRSPMAVEDRTSGITPGPTAAGGDQRPIIPAIFPASVASFLGINGQSVGVGEAAFAVVSTSASPGAPAEGADQAHSTAAFESANLVPSRLQASLFFSVEDAARIPGLSDALRADLIASLTDELDDQILTGTSGLFTGSNLGDNDASSTGTFATVKKRVVYDSIDGRYAGSAADLRIVMGAANYGFTGGLYRGNNSDVDALESITGKVAGVRVSSHVPAVASNKEELVVARGTAQHVAVALWEGMDLLEDPYSLSKSGEVILTARLLHAIKILRKGGYRKVELQHS